jgi:Holliday junction resolvasome RuvABC endonuclease subunit
MIFAGIDYSLTSPAVCVYNESAGDFCFANCEFFVLNDKKVPTTPKNIGIYPHKDWKDPNERYHNIATFIMNIYENFQDTSVLIEDYSMGSKGKVFHIAENTEVLQYNLWQKKIPYKKIPPTSLKKWATGKGNANKDAMYQKFLEVEGIDLINLLGLKNCDSPISDIVDSYWLCKYSYMNK